MNIVILIDRSKVSYSDFETMNIPKTFNSHDYLDGYCDGMFFGHSKIIKHSDFINNCNKYGTEHYKNWYLIPAIVVDCND